MLECIRPYCGVIVYLLILSYVGVIGRETFSNIYYSVAFTAKVLNANGDFWNTTDGHDHSQELALLELQSLQEDEKEAHSEEHQHSNDLPNKKLKYFNYLENQDLADIWMVERNFVFRPVKSDSFQSIDSPPPQS